MSKDVRITPASSLIEFSDTGIPQVEIFENAGDLHIEPVTGTVVIGDPVTNPSNVEIGTTGIANTTTFMGGTEMSANGNTIIVGAPGDTIDLNVPGVIYNFGSAISVTGGGIINPIAVGATAVTLACAMLEVRSTSKGVVFPRMTTAQKLAITAPVAGLQVYDLTLNKMSYYNGSTWVNF
jgi:hypothetical protein